MLISTGRVKLMKTTVYALSWRYPLLQKRGKHLLEVTTVNASRSLSRDSERVNNTGLVYPSGQYSPTE